MPPYPVWSDCLVLIHTSTPPAVCLVNVFFFFSLPVVMLLWHYAAAILEIKAQLVSVGPLEAWDISTVKATTNVGCYFLPSVPIPVRPQCLNVVKKDAAVCWMNVRQVFTWGDFAVQNFAKGDICFASPTSPPPTPSMYIWVVSRYFLIVALEKVSSIASKCAALPAFRPLSLLTFSSVVFCHHVNAVFS